MRAIKHHGRWLVCGVVSCPTLEDAIELLFVWEEQLAESGRLM